MAIDLNDDILQDFLVEAGEIIELLGEQLVELEKSSDDPDLLNSIFRGFHTVKGGAGFLGIIPLVELCHRSEDVFNLLRQGDMRVSADLMDVILKVHDSLVLMFEEINQGNEPTPADSVIIAALENFLAPGEVAASPPPEEEQPPLPEDGDAATPGDAAAVAAVDDSAVAAEGETGEGDYITDDEFESLLDSLHGDSIPGQEPASAVAAGSGNVDAQPAAVPDDEISEDEFERLLDRLHGGAAPGVEDAPQNSAETPAMEAAAHQETDPDPVVNHDSAAPVDSVAPRDEQSVNEKQPADSRDKPVKKEMPQGEASVRVDTRRLDDIMNLVGELVLVRNRLLTMQSLLADEEMSAVASNLDLVTADLQTAVMHTRMQPIKKVFGRFPRVVRDLARSLNKEVNLELVGEETDLDKNLVEALADPLVHLVRNAVDHGIEMPDVREQTGKARVGTVILSAEQEGDHILLRIKDDGAGMSADKIKSIAIAKGVIDEDTSARLDDKEAFNLIFMPGFSTKEEISDISGRGVGMDVVKTKITQLNGAIEVDSSPGKGSVIDIKVPLTLAIMPTLMVMLGEQIFALPLGSVVEIFNLDDYETNVVDGQKVVIIRGKPLPIYYLGEWLIGSESGVSDGDNHLVIVNAGGKQVGFVVERLLGQEEVVIKPLGSMLQGTAGIAGATITGNGKISLILDIPTLLARYAGKV